MDRENGIKIKHRLEDNGLTFTAVANDLEPKVSPQAVRQVAFQVKKSQRIIEALAKAAGLPESEIWLETKKAA